MAAKAADARPASACAPEPAAPSAPSASAAAPGADADADAEADVLEKALEQLGAFGLYQRYMLVMLCIPNLFAAMYSLNYVFVADAVAFR